MFNAGREGLLPSFFGYVHPTRRTPNNAIVTFAVTALLIIGGWGLGHLLGSGGDSMDPVVFFTESSTLGTILILLVYLASNIALPLYYRRYRPQEFRVVRHLVLAGARHRGHPGPAVLPRQAGPARPVQLVPLRGPGRPARRRRLRGPPGPPRPGSGRPGRVRGRGRGLKARSRDQPRTSRC